MIKAKGSLTLNQKEPFALGAIKREINLGSSNSLYYQL